MKSIRKARTRELDILGVQAILKNAMKDKIAHENKFNEINFKPITINDVDFNNAKAAMDIIETIKNRS